VANFEHPYDFPIDETDRSISLVSTSTFYRAMGLEENFNEILNEFGGWYGMQRLLHETASDNNRMINVIRNSGPWELVGSYLRVEPRFHR
jgi:hypothetical protein